MEAEIGNPWVGMSRRAPFVLPQDLQWVEAFNRPTPTGSTTAARRRSPTSARCSG